MKSQDPMTSNRSTPTPAAPTRTRREKLLEQEVLACEDPVCCCEAEPRWLRFQQECEGSPAVSEWEVLARPPEGEL